MHGGAPGSGGPKGRRNGNYRRGRYTAEAIASRRWLRHGCVSHEDQRRAPGGSRRSGGRRQRRVPARALIHGPTRCRSDFSRMPVPSARKFAKLSKRSGRSPTRTAFSARLDKAAIWMSGCSILSSSMCCRRNRCRAYCGTRFRATGRNRTGGWIARSRNAVHKRGPSWCSMTCRLALCATWNDFWMWPSTSAFAFGRISRRSAYPFSMDGSFGRSIIFFRRLATFRKFVCEPVGLLARA